MALVWLSSLAPRVSNKLLSAASMAAARQALLLLNGRKETKRAVIFDKDGTLIDIHAQWAPWIRRLVARIEAETNLSISAKAYSRLGFDDEAGRVRPGILGEGTMGMVRDCLSTIIQEESAISLLVAERLVEASLDDCSCLKSGEILPIGDAVGMFRRLKTAGFQIAINTSDSREETLRTLHQLGVSHLVDTMVCGDDDWMIVKPHPVSAYTICARLGMRPENTIMVGDSPCDVQLGTNAKLGCAIGVLTGIAPRQALQADAHIVARDVTEAVELILRGTGRHSSLTASSHHLPHSVLAW